MFTRIKQLIADFKTIFSKETIEIPPFNDDMQKKSTSLEHITVEYALDTAATPPVAKKEEVSVSVIPDTISVVTAKPKKTTAKKKKTRKAGKKKVK